MERKIYFDMDGTLADLYGVEDWLPKLEASDPSPYAEAAPLLRLCVLARLLNKLQRDGWELGIISWTSRGGSVEYNEAVAEAKLGWLKIHLKSVRFDSIDIVDYGTPKSSLGTGILFDDEARNRDEWGEGAYNANEIFEVLKALAKGGENE